MMLFYFHLFSLITSTLLFSGGLEEDLIPSLIPAQLLNCGCCSGSSPMHHQHFARAVLCFVPALLL